MATFSTNCGALSFLELILLHHHRLPNQTGSIVLGFEFLGRYRSQSYPGRRAKMTIESETAEDGLRLAEEKSPALILMDIQLSGMDGKTEMKQLKATPSTKAIPIIAITASAMTHNREAMFAEGFDGYQTKSLNLNEFLSDIERSIVSRGR
jgi:two-component system cell cycle response regulator DivK